MSGQGINIALEEKLLFFWSILGGFFFFPGGDRVRGKATTIGEIHLCIETCTIPR